MKRNWSKFEHYPIIPTLNRIHLTFTDTLEACRSLTSSILTLKFDYVAVWPPQRPASPPVPHTYFELPT